jgi:hypothetical protein
MDDLDLAAVFECPIEYFERISAYRLDAYPLDIGFLPGLRVLGDDANAIADRPHYIARAILAARIEIKKDGS